jgi:hypothetical protein
MVGHKEGRVNSLRIISLCLGVALVWMLAAVVWAGSTADGSLDWRLISGGGAPASGTGVSLVVSLGQTAIGPSGGGGYTLGAGFWYGMGGGEGWAYQVYLPVTMREY